MRLCNLFLLPAAGKSSSWKSEGAAGRASSGAKQPLLAGPAAPRVYQLPEPHAAADPSPSCAGRGGRGTRRCLRHLLSGQNLPGAHERLCPSRRCPCPAGPAHAEGSVPPCAPNRGTARAGLSGALRILRSAARPRRREGGEMSVSTRG